MELDRRSVTEPLVNVLGRMMTTHLAQISNPVSNIAHVE